ncbi:hypothetical protein AGR6A_Cc80015 [Agrobacterium sp. NCPPB 925]|nr:hypothetical protein AGR6A_Cc80015 [Agrobacterium sp. NCPPB 925]
MFFLCFCGIINFCFAFHAFFLERQEFLLAVSIFSARADHVAMKDIKFVRSFIFPRFHAAGSHGIRHPYCRLFHTGVRPVARVQ